MHGWLLGLSADRGVGVGGRRARACGGRGVGVNKTNKTNETPPELLLQLQVRPTAVCARGLRLAMAQDEVGASSLRALFTSLDTDGSGHISTSELLEALEARGECGRQVGAMVRAVDKDKNGEISWAEFEEAFSHIGEGASLSHLIKQWQALGAQVNVGGDLGATGAPPAGMPLWRFALAGSSGAVASRLVTAPLEKATLIMQATGKTGSQAVGALREVVRLEGMRGLWTGAGANGLRVALFGGAVCIGYSQSVRLSPADDELDVRRATRPSRECSSPSPAILPHQRCHPTAGVRAFVSLDVRRLCWDGGDGPHAPTRRGQDADDRGLAGRSLRLQRAGARTAEHAAQRGGRGALARARAGVRRGGSLHRDPANALRLDQVHRGFGRS